MTQLVGGLAEAHPIWRMDGEKFPDRDRHHSYVRRHLETLRDLGLIEWRPDPDVHGDDARTVIILLAAPAASELELAEAARRLAKWQRTYDKKLNTGSSTGIVDALDKGRPLTKSQQQRRGIARARAKSAASKTNSAPHFVTPTTSSEKSLAVAPSTNAQITRNACGEETRVTCTGSNGDFIAVATLNRPGKTASTRTGGPGLPRRDAGVELGRSPRGDRSARSGTQADH